jgi:hypothetical protein
MAFRRDKIYLVFRYLWLALALSVIIYIINANLILGPNLVYQVDLSQGITRNIEGPYPSTRVHYDDVRQELQVLAEPLYLQAYVPGSFDQLLVTGQVVLGEQVLSLGLKQADGTWQWQDMSNGEFGVVFSLDDVYLRRNKLELIFSLPNLAEPNQVQLQNLQLTFSDDDF